MRVLEFQRRLPECEESSPHREGNNPEADVGKAAMKVLAGEEEQEERREQKQVLSPQGGAVSLEGQSLPGGDGQPGMEGFTTHGGRGVL